MLSNHPGLHRRTVVLGIAGALAMVVGSVAAAAPAQFARGSRLANITHPAPTAHAGKLTALTRPTRLRAGSRLQGALSGAHSLHVVVSLKLRNETRLQTLLKGQRRPSHAQMAASYLPTATQAQAVAAFLTGAGFTHVKISPNHLLVSADGSAAVAQAAFRTTLNKVVTVDGREAYANTAAIHIPTALADSVQAVLGLQTVHRAHTLARVRPNAAVGTLSAHSAMDFPELYNASSLPPATDVDVAVWGWGNMSQTLVDLNTFAANNHLSPGNVEVVCVDVGGSQGNNTIGDATCGGNVDSSGVGEWNMDSQNILAMSGGVHSMTFYAGSRPTNAELVDALAEIVNPTLGETLPQVVNASFGECELYTDANQGGDGTAQVMDQLFQLATSKGMTFAVSTGDSGANECGYYAGDRRASASWPAASPWVVAVSGTTMRTSGTTLLKQTTWVHSGGSPSSFEPAQSWQAPLTYGPYQGARGPDVAFDANPYTGSMFIVGGNPVIIGGTSLSAPLFAGAWARILQSDPGLGFAAPHLYALPASALLDVRRGGNGGWTARAGWDYATGLGSIDVAEAAAALATGR